MESEAASMQLIATILFLGAVLHTFSVKKLQEIGNRLQPDSIGENLVHFLSEIEVVFGIWAGLFITFWSFRFGTDSAVAFLDSIDFSESVFVLVIMCMGATNPIISPGKPCSWQRGGLQQVAVLDVPESCGIHGACYPL